MDSRLSRINTLWSVVRNAHDSQEDVARQGGNRRGVYGPLRGRV